MARTFHLDAECHCGAIRQPVRPPGLDELAYLYRAGESFPKAVNVCHCNSCRHATGSLYTTHFPSQRPVLDRTTAFPAIKTQEMADRARRFFCTRCGCHVFRLVPDRERNKYKNNASARNSDLSVGWGVASGLLEPIAFIVWFSDHVFVQDTRDGGAACWLKEMHRDPLSSYAREGRNYYTGKIPPRLTLQEKAQPCPSIPGQTQLHALCLCKSVHFHITRPDVSQDIVSPAAPEFLPRDSVDTKWWLCENGTKYLAGLCACRSCRLASGFEIQPWAFIPRASIIFQTESDAPVDTPGNSLEFADLSSEIFSAYETSESYIRHFCKTCGATVFSHEKSKPDLVRVSVGLFAAAEGARAETWLKWWTKRIGFQEQAMLDRPPRDEYEQNDIVDCFARDLAIWGGDAE